MRHCPLASENVTITWKRCKIGSKLVLITNKKSYTSFRLVPKSVTLNGVMPIALRYFTDFSKPAFQHMTASISGRIYARVYIL